jgi:hypothetical protein
MIGMNEKGGMTNHEFDRYIKNSVIPLFPYLADGLEKLVLLKVNGGLGCNGHDLMLNAQFWGVYIFPRLPNARSVQHKTDDSYGPVKNVIRNNLKRITSAFFDAGTTMKLGQLTFRLIVYGRICPLSGIVCRNAVNKAFSVMSNLKPWRQVGAVLFTKKCLRNPKVWHTILAIVCARGLRCRRRVTLSWHTKRCRPRRNWLSTGRWPRPTLTMSKPSQQTSPQCSKGKKIVLFTLCIIIIVSLFSFAIIYWDGTTFLQK